MKTGITLLFIFLLTEAFGQNLQWGFGQTGVGTQYSKTLKLRNGRIYCAGIFQNSFDADPGAGVVNLVSNGAYDIFLTIYDTDGNLISANSIGGSGNEGGMPGLSIDPLGNIYLTYEFENTIDADFSPTSSALFTSSGGTDFLIAKYDSVGTYLWAVQLHGYVAETGNGIVADSDFVYVTGSYEGTVDFDPGASVNVLTASARGIYVARYTASGVHDWAFSIDNQFIIGTGNNLRLDSNGNLLLAGYFGGTNVDFNPRGGQALRTSTSSQVDVFLAKYDALGNYIWSNNTGGSGALDNAIYAMELDGNDIVVGGYLQGNNIDLDPGAATLSYSSNGVADAYLARFDTNGNLIWAKAFGSSQYEDVIGLAIAPDGDIVLTGGFGSDTVLIDTGDTLFTPIADANYDGYVAEFDQNGNFKWSMVYGDSLWDQGGAVVIDQYDNWYIAGIFGRKEVDIDPSSNTFLVAGGSGMDNLLFKLSPCLRLNPDLPNYLQVKEDASISISCQVSIGSPVAYSWYKEGALTSSTGITISFPMAAFSDEGNYSVKVRDGCYNNRWSDTMIFSVIPSIKIYQLISPNGDDANEFFHIRNIELEQFKNHSVTILNRWGQKVFQSNQYQNNWNGENLPDGTYFYFVNVGEEEFKGSLLIKR